MWSFIKNYPKTFTVVVALIVVTGWFVKPYFIGTWIVATVKEKSGQRGEGNFSVIVKYNNNDYRELLANTDALWRLKWNSGDIQKDLEVDKTYRIKVLGRRVSLWSGYRNIMKQEKVGD